MVNSINVREDYSHIACDSCGVDVGSFYRHDDGDVVCLDCLLAMPSRVDRDYNDALAQSRNWNEHPNENGLILLACAHCGAVVYQHDEDDREIATMILEEDEEHQCEEGEG